MDNARDVMVRTTLDTLMFAQILKPVLGASSPLGAYESQAFAGLLARSLEVADREH